MLRVKPTLRRSIVIEASRHFRRACAMLSVGTPPNGEPVSHYLHQSAEHHSASFAAIHRMRQNRQVLYTVLFTVRLGRRGKGAAS
jgi:hypothetical protein